MSVSSRIHMQVVRSVAPEAEGSASTSTASTSAKLGSHTTGVADSGRWSTRRIAMYALFVALAMVTSFIEFPITPVTWLKYDPSGIVCLIAGFAYGPAAAAIVSVLGFVPHMFANPWGSLMAVLVALFLSVPAAFIYRKIRTRKGAAIGILVGAVLAIVVALFIAAAVIVGGRTGAKSLVALAVTLVCLFGVLLPALMKGANTLLMTFIVCAYVAVVSLTIVGGVQKKSVCAMLGAVAGTALALLFGLLAQALTRVDGLRIEDVEPLLQLRQTGTPIGLRGLLVGGIIISALGAVMDVTMGIASSLAEVHAANPQLSRRELFRSGMNIGRDMVGTMTNTLILAFLGSGFTLILYLYSLGLSFRQLMSSAYVSMEVVSGIASSVGVILSIPLTALITAAVFTREKQQS